MNNEIKEIRDILFELQFLGNEETQSKVVKLHNYITNLQQENERLKENRDWWKDRFFGQQEYDDSHRITAIEYKKRIDKAIEILHSLNDTLPLDIILSEIEHSEYILQNGSDKQ